MYPGFQIMGSSGPLLEKFGGPLQSFGACTKTRNTETKPPERNHRNHRNRRNHRNTETKPAKHRNEKNETTETPKRNHRKKL